MPCHRRFSVLQNSALTNVKLQKKKYNKKKAEVMKVKVREWTFPTAVCKESKSRLANRKQYLTVHKPISLFEPQHLLENSLHNISPNVKYYFTHGYCIPQERTNKVSYQPWVCLKKGQWRYCHQQVFLCSWVRAFHLYCHCVQIDCDS